jgi:glycerol-3-phosphate acyltransferase PlsY
MSAKCTADGAVFTMAWMPGALVVIAAYFLGTFPTAVLVTRSKGLDVTREGSGNPGATNVYRVAGRRAAALVFAGDFLKGVLGAGAGLLISRNVALAAGAAAIVGHCFPVTRRFRGGKGVATAGGVVTVVEPLVALCALAVWVVLLKATKRASLASIVVVLLGPLAVLALRGPGIEALTIALLAVFIVLRHAKNILRLVRGEESALPGVDRSR